LYLANRLPGTTDQTGGFWRRWVVIEFNRRFTDDEKDTTLARKILATERPAVTAWLLEGARRALKQDRYTIPTSSTKAIARWRRCADQVAEYIAESWEPRPANDTAYTAWPKADWVYQCYRAWAQSNGHRPVSSVKFGERMALLGHGSHKTKSHYAYPIQNRVA
jgi:phage/plasmid-associated DNA primase